MLSDEDLVIKKIVKKPCDKPGEESAEKTVGAEGSEDGRGMFKKQKGDCFWSRVSRRGWKGQDIMETDANWASKGLCQRKVASKSR